MENRILGVMRRKDAVISSVIGLMIGGFFLIFLKVIIIDLGLFWKKEWDWMLPVGFSIASVIGMFVASWIGRKFLVIYQIAKFGLVGALNTFVDFGVLSLFFWVTGVATGTSYSFFKGVSFIVAAFNSYFWNKHWTFEKGGKAFQADEFLKFIIVTFIGFLLNVGTATIMVVFVGPQYGLSDIVWGYVAAFVATLVAFLWNFIGSKFIVFKK